MLRLPPKLIQAPGLRPGVPSSSSDSWRHSNHPGLVVPDWQVRNGQPKGAVDQRFFGDFTNKNSGFSAAKIWMFVVPNICGSDRIWPNNGGFQEQNRDGEAMRTSNTAGLHSLKFCGVTLAIPNKNGSFEGHFPAMFDYQGIPGPMSSVSPQELSARLREFLQLASQTGQRSCSCHLEHISGGPELMEPGTQSRKAGGVFKD